MILPQFCTPGNPREPKIPADTRLPLATQVPDQGAFIPSDAAWLLIHSDVLPDHGVITQLPTYWRAVAATKSPDWRAAFLQEIEQSLGAMSVISVQQQGLDELACCGREHQTCWASQQFPQSLIDDIHVQSPQRFEVWLDALLADELRAMHWWGGLVMPMFQTALRTGNPRTRTLWRLVFPFQRQNRARGVTRWVSQGIDWVLHALSHGASDNSIATELLTDLVCQAESDQELFHIALGARFQGQERLSRVVIFLLESPNAEMRARALRVAGWLEETSAIIAMQQRSDPSLWVRRVAELALASQRLETWARHWLQGFISDGTPESRWGAGQLFLACVDNRYQVWCQPIIHQPGVSDRMRGEAILLLEAAQQVAEKEEQKLRETFLLHKLSDLRAVCHPWHSRIEWEEFAVVR